MAYKRIVGTVAAGIILTTTSATAGVQDEMDGLFNSMTNVTPPGYFETTRRGVISGGHYVERNKIMSANLISMTPASMEAGCGGLDLYGGSFSFIGADEFVQLLRSIASNAKGYAFQLAMKAMSSTIAETMENLQKKVQSFNQHFGNSCQMAQGLVNDTVSAVTGKQNSEASLIAMTEGASQDIFSAFGDNNTQAAVNEAVDGAPDVVREKIQGNIVWRAMKKSNASGWFAAGDDSLLEAMMSVTGSIVVGDLQAADDGHGDNFNTTPIPPLDSVTIEALVEGKEVEIYNCQDGNGENECLDVNIQTANLTGFREMAENILYGLIDKFATNSGAPTPQETAFLAASPAGFGAMLRTLSAHSPELARAFVHQTAPFISLEMAQIVLSDMVQGVRNSMTTSDHAQATKVIEMISEAQRDVDAQVLAVQKKYGASLQDMFASYESFINSARKNRYWKNKTEELAAR